MEIFKQIAPLKAFLRGVRLQGKSIGMVPTMGALHTGHLSLIKASQEQNQITVCTVFVNPTQFNNANDLLKYPRSLGKDTEMLEEVRCDVLFCPEIIEIYPAKSSIRIDFGELDKIMEGKFRPGHFSGVGVVVSKLLHIVDPQHVYFGQKDWQQFAILRQLVEELNFNVQIHSIPTLRESDGLALSSRNLRLTASQRPHATVFYRALLSARTSLKSGSSIEKVQKMVKKMVEEHPEVTLEYFEVAESKNLNLVENVERADQPIMCIAGYVGEVRLIDNMFVD
jgi:pantoate--beta-alanine ligase